MHGPRRAAVCLVLVAVAVTQAAAQARDGWPAADGTAEQPPPLLFQPPDGSKKPVRRPDIFSPKTKPLNFHGTIETSEDLETIGGRLVEEPDGVRWAVREHTYGVDVTSDGRPPLRGPVTGAGMQEGQRHFLKKNSDGVEAAQTSGAGGDEWQGSATMNGPGEGELSPAVWSREADLWSYQEGEWTEVRLPDSSYLSLPTPAPPAAALVVAAVGKVEIQRSLEGLKNVTIHCRFYLSDSHHPDDLPELTVYFVGDGSRDTLEFETTRGAWQEQTIHVPEANTSSIIIEGWLKANGDIIALSDLYTTGVTAARDDALDAYLDQKTLTVSTAENDTSTLESEGNGTDSEYEDSATRPNVDDDTQLDATPTPDEEGAEEGTRTVTPTDESELETSTGIPEGRLTEQVDGSTDVVSLNSTILASDNMTSGVSSDLQDTMTATDAENNEEDEGGSSTAAVADGEPGASENVTEDAFETEAKEDITTLFIPGVTTDSLQTNASITLPEGNATATDGPFTPSEVSVGSETASNVTEEPPFTGGQNLSTIISGTDNGSSATLGRPDFNTTLENVTGGTALPTGVIMDSTPYPTGNSTDTVMARPMSNTSWRVFQFFIVLCVMGLLALGFLYLKKKRRQDDEIPVFTRHTDYHNPTFTMEDAANFMSRSGRSTYKTIE